ncbi:hypothetical protein D3C80_1441390 [compost metagenome]
MQVDQVAHLFTHLDHGLERGELGVGDVDMGAYVLNAVVDQHADGLGGAGLDVFVGGDFLAFGPALDAFEQGATHVPLRLAGSEGGVEVDVRLDEGGYHQVLPGIQVIAGPWCHRTALGLDAGDAVAVQFDAKQASLAPQACIDDVHGVTPCLGLRSCAKPAWPPKRSYEKADRPGTGHSVVRCVECVG